MLINGFSLKIIEKGFLLYKFILEKKYTEALNALENALSIVYIFYKKRCQQRIKNVLHYVVLAITVLFFLILIVYSIILDR